MDFSLLPAPILIGLGGLFGLMIGSFFNVVIFRMPRGESVVWPASHCTRCGYVIKWYENLPVVSWLALRGKCRSCSERISIQYPLVELLTGVVAAILIWFWLNDGRGYDLDFKIAVTFLIIASIPIFIIDFRHFLIPDMITFPGIFLGLAISFLPGGGTPMRSVIGALACGSFLWVVGFVAGKIMKKDAMGLGDVKLLAMTGSLFGAETALLGLLFAAFLGTVAGVPMLLLRKLDEHRHIPFGPYICLGTLLSAFYGPTVLNWYFGLLSR